MEVDVIINGQLANNAGLTEELHEDDNNVGIRTLSKDKKYHVFFCYRDIPNDNLWVKEAVKKLENDGYICCVHDRDFLGGTNIMNNIKDGIKNSEKVVSVLSKEGLDSKYLLLETEMALREGIDKRENLLIPVLLDNCEIPDELKVLTYIDARKEINERIWWPRLIAAIESKGRGSFINGMKEGETKHNADDHSSFYFKKLCALGTTFSCFQCSIQSTPKYIPRELVSNEEAVPVETIKNLKRDLLDVPGIRCKQKCCCFVNGCLLFCLTLLALVFVFDLMAIIACATTEAVSKEDCFRDVGIYFIFEISIGICCGVGWKCYYKDSDEMETFVVTSELQAEHESDDAPLLNISGNDEPAQTNKVYQKNVDQRHMDDEKGSTIVNLSDQENEPQQSQNSQIEQSSDLGKLENVAMTLLLKYAHEYLRLVFRKKMKNPKEIRHSVDYICLCQYIEKTDKKFRKLVDRNKSILAKTSSIEHITENKELDAFRL